MNKCDVSVFYGTARHLLSKQTKKITEHFLKNKWHHYCEGNERRFNGTEEFNENLFTVLTVISAECELFCCRF